MESELAMYIINGLLGLLLLIIGYVVKDVINTQKEHAKLIEANTREISENKSSIKANTAMDAVVNTQVTTAFNDLKASLSGIESRILEQLKANEKVSTDRLNAHSKEIKNINERIVKIEAKVKL